MVKTLYGELKFGSRFRLERNKKEIWTKQSPKHKYNSYSSNGKALNISKTQIVYWIPIR